MLDLDARNLLLSACLASIFSSSAAAQFYARAPREVAVPGNAACGPTNCAPQFLTFGYHHEHWRRWPAEPSSQVSPESLSPFAQPSRDIPALTEPDTRDENSLSPRRRQNELRSPTADDAATPGRPGVQPSAPSDQLPETQPPSAEMEDLLPDSFGTPTEDSREPFSEPAAPTENEGGFFPSVQPDTTLPDTFPNGDLDSEIPGDLDSRPPSEELDFGPSSNDADDVFDLDDFSQVDPRRVRRYGMASKGQMRSPAGGRARAVPRHVRSSPRSVQFAAYRSSVGGRRNPLRGESDMIPQNVSSRDVQAAVWETEPIADEQLEHGSAAPIEASLDWTPEEALPLPSGAVRRNPLR